MYGNKNSKGSVTALCFISAFLSLICLFLAGYFISTYPENFLYITVLGACVLVFLLVVSSIIINAVFKKRKIDGPNNPALGSIMYDKIRSLKEPAFICDSHGQILWYNTFMQEKSGETSPILGHRISQYIHSELFEEGEIADVIYGERNYSVERSKVDIAEKTYFLFVFRDITEKVALEKELRDTDKLIAFVVVDNLDELLQFEQEKYREASSEIGELIRDWAASVNGVIKEYERDKYIFIFDAQYLDVFRTEKLNELEAESLEDDSNEQGFNILKKARNIRIGAANIPVTLSIGIAQIDGTFAEKEKASHACLEMALQRGGDQAAVKIGNDFKYYGARFSAAQRRTRVKARVVANELVGCIANASNVIIMAHKFPDYDAIGASVGVAKFCQFCGVKYNIVTNFNDLNVIKAMKLIEDDDTYKGIFVDGASGLDLISNNTLLILVDVNNFAMIENPDIARNVEKFVIIDHHRKMQEYDTDPIFTYIETSASSASELVTEMLEQTVPAELLKQNEANMLFAGISLDTKQLTKNTGTKTYGAAMYLRERGASYDDIANLFKTSLSDFLQETKYGELVEIYNGHMAIVAKENGNSKTDRILAARVADSLLKIDDVEASFVVVKISDIVHVSARSSGNVNVHLILEEIGGGGHYNAAGGQFAGDDVKNIVERLKKAIDKYSIKES